MSMLRVEESDPEPQAWDALVAGQPLPSPFLRSWWLTAMPAGPGSVFVTMYDGDRLVGGVPLVLDRFAGLPRYRLRGQGVLCPDHLDLVAAPGRRREVARAFGGWFRSGRGRLLDAAGLVPGSLLSEALGVRSDRLDVAPYQQLPATPEEYLAGRSAGFRRALRRAERRHAEAGLAHRRAVGRPEVESALEHFRALHEGRPGRERLLAELPTLRTAVVSGAERGEVQVDLLTDGETVAAVSLFFRVARRLSFYQLARSLDRAHDGAGTVLIHRIVQDGIRSGIREIDLLRGGERYKWSFAEEARELHRLRAGHGVPARLLVGAAATAARVRAAAPVGRPTGSRRSPSRGGPAGSRASREP